MFFVSIDASHSDIYCPPGHGVFSHLIDGNAHYLNTYINPHQLLLITRRDSASVREPPSARSHHNLAPATRRRRHFHKLQRTMADVPQVAKLTFENLQRHLQPTYTFKPMDKESFEVYLKKWLEPHPQDPSLLVYEGRPIDLHKLHCEVIRAGGVRQIVDKDQWPIIAARVAFGDPLGAEAQYARADTAFVQRVYNVYQVFLRSFDERHRISTLHTFHDRESGCAKYYVGSVPRRPDVTNTATNTSMERPVPPPDERQLVFETLGRLRNETKSLLFPTTSSNLISEAQQAEYRSALNRFSHETKIANKRFANFTCVSTVAGLKSLVRVILAAEYQQELLSRDPPQYILSLEQLKSMAAQLHSADQALIQHFMHVALMHVALR